MRLLCSTTREFMLECHPVCALQSCMRGFQIAAKRTHFRLFNGCLQHRRYCPHNEEEEEQYDRWKHRTLPRVWAVPSSCRPKQVVILDARMHVDMRPTSSKTTPMTMRSTMRPCTIWSSLPLRVALEPSCCTGRLVAGYFPDECHLRTCRRQPVRQYG